MTIDPWAFQYSFYSKFENNMEPWKCCIKQYTWYILWNAKAEKIQDVKKSHQNDYFKPRKYFLNPENIISYPRLFTPQPLRLRGIVVPRADGRAGGRADKPR